MNAFVLISVFVDAATKAQSVAPWIALGVSVVALLLSAYQYWRTEVAPARLTVMPPAITQANDEVASLIVDMVVMNEGSRPTVISDVTLRLYSEAGETGIALHAQKSLSREGPFSAVPLDAKKTTAALFLPILVRRMETQAFRLYCAPWASELPLDYRSLLGTIGIKIDLVINRKSHLGVFTVGYEDFRDKFRDGGTLVIPEEGFAPRWYLDLPPVVIQG